MNKKIIAVAVVLFIVASVFILVKMFSAVKPLSEMEQRALFVQERLKYEYEILKDPATGKIPKNIREQELVFAKGLPIKEDAAGAMFRTSNLNNYTPGGPNNIGGRTRALAFDVRFGTAGNQVILSGSVSGGIYRSADGGASWTKVSPETELHNLTSIAQDTRPGFQDTWYAGGGEALGNSASGGLGSSFYYGYGILKSTNNGISWTRLTLAVQNTDGSTLTDGVLEGFDNVFDLVHKIVVNPVNGHVYIAGHRRLVRSTNSGQSFQVVFGGAVGASSNNGQMDIVSTTTGKLFLAVNGGNPDVSLRGVWTSTSGNNNSWQRIAGGQTLGIDSINGWRGNISGNQSSKRIILALAPSNQNILYAMYENGLSQAISSDGKPEADLFKFDFAANTSLNLSANMPDFPGQSDGIDPLALQGGYNMALAVKPDDPNVVFVGGTNLYRSTDGFTTTANTEWIGGYRKKTVINAEQYPNSHPDIHGLVFDPTNPNKAYCNNDGGIQVTENIMGTAAPDPVAWTMVSNYQTMQYYHVAIDPMASQNNFLGGAQDNGCYFRSSGSATPNNHFRITGGDGAAVSIASFTGNAFTLYLTSQLGNIVRDITNSFVNITPTGLTANPQGGSGDFVTYFKMDFDNPEHIYYVNFNRIFRTSNASAVTPSTWEEITSVGSTVNPGNPSGNNISIRALELSRGAYLPSHVLYIGTGNGKVYRLNDPKNALATTAPVSISPAGMTGNVSDIAVNPNNDDEILVTVSNYGVTSIWWTNNARSDAPTWRNVEGNLTLPSVRSCMIIVKKDASNVAVTEYYVGTSVGLYSTTDINASTVTWVREGSTTLGMAVTTSLDYRPQDNVFLVGTHGNGMFFTNVGTPNYTPNIITSVTGPVRNDKNFIQQVYPTLAANQLNYRTGNMFSVKSLAIRINNLSGQLVYSANTGYQNGSIDISNLSGGAYILSITSSDGKNQFVQKFVKGR